MLASRLASAALRTTAARAVSIKAPAVMMARSHFHSSTKTHNSATGPRIHGGADPSIKTTVTQMHEYGQYLTSVMPKFIQQFSVYKDELTIYIAPNALLPVMEFLRDHH
ncbi:NADH dehydrogenase (ubiquinone) Fe-S protein 3 [Podila verticillata NRRL 6337]|nr:NADH dehydrogenase (ubiquinone) Fe-S protein 3 [Podila verticillata NRRL 6337]